MKRKHGYCDLKQQLQFIRMRGPYLKGFAEMAFDTVEVQEEEKNCECSDLDRCALPPEVSSTWHEWPLPRQGGGPSTDLFLPPPSLATSSSHNGHTAARSEMEVWTEMGPSTTGAVSSNGITAPCSQRELSPMDSCDPLQSASLIPQVHRVEKSALLLRLIAAQERGNTDTAPAESTFHRREDPTVVPLATDESTVYHQPTHTHQVAPHKPVVQERVLGGSRYDSLNGTHVQEMTRKSMFL